MTSSHSQASLATLITWNNSESNLWIKGTSWSFFLPCNADKSMSIFIIKTLTSGSLYFLAQTWSKCDLPFRQYLHGGKIPKWQRNPHPSSYVVDSHFICIWKGTQLMMHSPHTLTGHKTPVCNKAAVHNRRFWITGFPFSGGIPIHSFQDNKAYCLKLDILC